MGAGIPLTWRVLAAESRKDYSLLVDRAFGLSAPKSYLADFPVWDPDLAPMTSRHQVGGFYGPRLVCTASIRFANYRFPDRTETKLGLIGAVATHPEFTRRGYASEALALVIHEADRRGAGAFALWGSDSPIYRKRRFEFAGKQVRVPLRSLHLPGSPLGAFEFRSGWDPAIAGHFTARKTGLLYETTDVDWLSRHVNVEWRTLWIGGKCQAYVGWNRGIDLPNIVHELDGDPEGCLALLGYVRDQVPNLEWIAHPELLARWKIRGAEDATPEPLAQFRLRSLGPEKVDGIWFSGMDAC